MTIFILTSPSPNLGYFVQLKSEVVWNKNHLSTQVGVQDTTRSSTWADMTSIVEIQKAQMHGSLGDLGRSLPQNLNL
jgi:hypothetical protein